MYVLYNKSIIGVILHAHPCILKYGSIRDDNILPLMACLNVLRLNPLKIIQREHFGLL